MADKKKSNEFLLPKKEGFYSHLNMKVITAADYTHKKRFCEYFKIFMIYIIKRIYYC